MHNDKHKFPFRKSFLKRFEKKIDEDIRDHSREISFSKKHRDLFEGKDETILQSVEIIRAKSTPRNIRLREISRIRDSPLILNRIPKIFSPTQSIVKTHRNLYLNSTFTKAKLGKRTPSFSKEISESPINLSTKNIKFDLLPDISPHISKSVLREKVFILSPKSDPRLPRLITTSQRYKL